MSDHPRTIGKYQIQRVIGAGAMGTVYAAIDPTINRKVAIKTAHQPNTKNQQDVANRFVQEAQLLAKCNHPNIITILDFGQQDHLAYMVMEFVNGPDLQKWLRSLKHLSLKLIIALFVQLLKALNKAHSQGIIHRDFKPENILVETPNTLKLTDFGIAKQGDNSNMTQLGITMGTPKYMAPEQMFGTDEVGPHTDIYALFVVLYQLMGQLKSPEKHDAMPLAQIDQLAKHNQFNPSIAIPLAMHDFMIKGLSPSVADRYQNAQSVGQALKHVLAALQSQNTRSEQSEDSTSGIFTTGTVITQSEATWRIDDDVFDQMRSHLADLIGPMADYILTHALKNSQSHDQLVINVAAQLDEIKSKDAFTDRWRQ